MSAQRESSDDPPVDRCPWCEEEDRDERGTYDSRITLNGRHTYVCPRDREHRWQDINEKPSNKGAILRPRA